jgi:hypothetical protein
LSKGSAQDPARLSGSESAPDHGAADADRSRKRLPARQRFVILAGDAISATGIAPLLAFAVPLLFYAATLQGGLAYWDTGEMQTVPWVFGIAHPTGFPFFTILAGIFAHVFAAGAVSARIAFFCVLTAALCAWFVCRIICTMGGDPAIALLFAWMYAAGDIVWSRGTRAEAHDLAACLGLASITLALEWGKNGDARLLALCALVLGLGIASHPIVLLITPGLLLIVLIYRRRLSVSAAAVALVCVGIGLWPMLYLPLRSQAVVRAGLDPNPALGKPPGAAIWNTDDPRSLHNFIRLVSGADFSPSRTLQNAFSSSAVFGRVKTLAEAAYWEFGPLGCAALIVGFALAGATRTYLWIPVAIAAIVPGMFAAGYTIEADPQRYLLMPFALAAAVAGYGCSSVAPSHRGLVRWPLAAACAMLLVMNLGAAYSRHISSARWLVDDIRARTPDDALIIAYWSVGTPLAYAAYVERSMGRRTIDIAFLGQDAPYVPQWLVHRPVFVYGSIDTHIAGIKATAVEADVPFYRLAFAHARRFPRRVSRRRRGL